MSKPSRRSNRQRRPKKKRDRELKRQIEQLPILATFYDEDGNACEFDLDCDACWAQLRGNELGGLSDARCQFCAGNPCGSGIELIP